MVAQKLEKLTQARANENICSSDAQIIHRLKAQLTDGQSWLFSHMNVNLGAASELM